jgi:hypothetical protein
MRTYTCKIFDVEYKYRGLNRREVTRILREFNNDWDREDQFVLEAVIFVYLPSGVIIPGTEYVWQETYAGIITQLAAFIATASGLTPEGSEIFRNEAHEWISSKVGHSEMLMMGICGMSLSEIHELEPADWYYQAVAVETLFELQNSPPQQQQQPPPGPPVARSPGSKTVQHVPEQQFSIRSGPK